MTITELKNIAATEYGITLERNPLLKRYHLFIQLNARPWNAGFITDSQIERGISEEQFREICEAAANPPKPTAEETAEFRAAEMKRRKPGRSIVTGRYQRMEKVQ